MEKQNMKAWLYLLPAFLFLGAFMIYPLIDVFVYSFEEGYNSASQTFYGVGMYNYSYVLHDPYFLQALKNTFILVIITVPVSTGLALLISAALSSIKPLRDLFQTIFFLPYVTKSGRHFPFPDVHQDYTAHDLPHGILPDHHRLYRRIQSLQ